VIAGAAPGLGDAPGVYHYAPDRHALERRCSFDRDAWPAVAEPDRWLIALTSIHWREAWKYGERAFRYCQHDLGHAIAAIRIAAANAGVEAEREEPGCIIDLRRSGFEVRRSPFEVRRSSLLVAARDGQWTGKASQLSEDHVTWTFIDEIAAATRDPGRDVPARPASPAHPAGPAPPAFPAQVILQRRSAVAFDGESALAAPVFLSMLSRVIPHTGPPWDVMWWDARIHLAIFVHRVDGLEAGLYLLARDRSAVDRLRAACRPEFLWDAADQTLPLYRLAAGDYRTLARRLSCDQDIAADGFFSLGMIAEFDASLQAFGPSFYRHLFWESGVVGQVLYLAAEAAGTRATGIGCFYDDPVHEALGIADHSFQSLYHFTVGSPVDDTRLTTEPGYPWEVRS
jgi:nitroreductase